MVPDDITAERGLEYVRWGKDGVECPRCNSQDRVKERQIENQLHIGVENVVDILMFVQVQP